MSGLSVESVALSDKEFQKISNLVYKHCGINLHQGKKELVRARLAKWLRQNNFHTFEEYIQYVLEDGTGQEFSRLIDSLSTNLTGFFREPQHFEFLGNEFLPSLLERKRKSRNFRIRGWSAGCSSGEEPYSIAITLLEAAQGRGRWDVKLLGTDISTRMLDVARRGAYDGRRIATIPPARINAYFTMSRTNGRKTYQVKDDLKEIVIFEYLNLMTSWRIKGPVDFIFCRNVMIYFDKSTQQDLILRFWDLLDSGGILFTGHSESLAGVKHQFRYIQPTIYSKP